MDDKGDRPAPHLFVARRLIRAFRGDEPDRETARATHASLAWIGGPVLAVVIALVVLVAGYLQAPATPASTPWRQEGAILVEQETGTLYVFLHGALHPAADEASARLAAAAVVPVPDPPAPIATADLAGAPRGAAIGIPGAPATLPPALAGSMALCTGAADDGTAGGVALTVPAPAQDAVGDSQGVLISGDTKIHLLWHGRRYELADDVARTALGVGVAPIPVGADILDLIPAGQPVHVTGIPETGTPAMTVDGTRLRNGATAVSRDPATGRATFYLVLYSQLLAVTETEARLALNDPANAKAYDGRPVAPVELSPAGVAGAPRSGSASVAGDWPPVPPELANDRSVDPGQLCLRLDPGVGARSIGGGPSAAATPTATPAASPGAAPTPPAAAGSIHALVITSGKLSLPPPGSIAPQIARGGGVLIRAVHDNVQGPMWLLVEGGLHRLADEQARAALGYQNAPMMPLPEKVISMLPSGPELSLAAAVTPP